MVVETAEAYIEETCHTSTEATIETWPTRITELTYQIARKTVCCLVSHSDGLPFSFASLAQRDIATCRLLQHPGKTRGPLGLPHLMLLFRLFISCADCSVPTRSKTSFSSADSRLFVGFISLQKFG